MGLFDFLKISVKDKNAPAKASTKPLTKPNKGKSVGTAQFDSKSYPLLSISIKGFVITEFDDSLIAGQNARTTITVDDQFGRFSFTTNIGVDAVEGDKCACTWVMLGPDEGAAIRKYVQNKKAAGK